MGFLNDLLGGQAGQQLQDFANRWQSGNAHEMSGQEVADTYGEFRQRRLRLLARFRTHDILDAGKSLRRLRLDHEEQHHRTLGMLGAARGVGKRDQAFRRIVDDHQEFRRVALLVAAALGAHDLRILHGARQCHKSGRNWKCG